MQFLNEGVNKQINNMDTSNCVYVRIYDTHGRPKYSISTFGITSKEKYTQFCEKLLVAGDEIIQNLLGTNFIILL